ncbi:AIPR family protein [Psychrobacter cibarius]|uniref:AIPR family protein n=1 Tax=Psychrobacter cibarius TaxID=282669 RepID=UPI003FD1AD86
MHIILKKNIEELQHQFGFDEEDSKLFEIFCNFCIVSTSFLGRYNPYLVTTQEDDASIDGIAFIIDGDLISTEDDAKQIFSTHKTGLDTKLIITQAKSGDKFKKEEIANFGLGIKDFLSLDPKLPNGSINKEALKILEVILNNLSKIRNKIPDIEISYCTSGIYKEEREINAAFEILERDVENLDMFNSVIVKALGRTELIKIWSNINTTNEAKLQLREYFGIPKMPNIPQSYIALVSAKEFVDNLLTDDNGNIKNEVFEENIRAYLGDTPVNNKIKSTLQDDSKSKIFSVLNNGITIVTPELTLTPNSKVIELKNYQIINGCQTSNTLFENYDSIDEETSIVVKCIESTDEDSISEIISATNSQTVIPFESFFSLKEKSKLIQNYFNVKNEDVNSDSNIFFERRENEYKHKQYQQSRIFDIKLLCRAYNAMFLDQPHNSARYVTKIFDVQKDELFKLDDHEAPYYTSALAHYKFSSMINSKKSDANKYSFLRWHIFFIFKHVIHGKVENIKSNSNKIDKYCSKIINILSSSDKKYEYYFQECFNIIDSIELPTRDSIKRGKYQSDLLTATTSYLKTPNSGS